MSEQLYIDLYTKNQDELQDWLSTQKHDGEWQESCHAKSYAISAWEKSHDQTTTSFKKKVDEITKTQLNNYLEFCESEAEMKIVLSLINNIRKELCLGENK